MAGSAQLAVTSTTFTDLGACPVAVQVLGQQPVMIVIADSLPAVGTAGFVIGNAGGPNADGAAPRIIQPADASHAYVAMYGVIASLIAYSPVLATATI